MDILTTLNPGATSGGADSAQKGSRKTGDGSFADLLSSTRAAGKTKSGKGAPDSRAGAKTAQGAGERATDPSASRTQKSGRADASSAKPDAGPSAADSGPASGIAGAVGTGSEPGAVAADGSTPNNFTVGLAGAMLNTVASTPPAAGPTPPITAAVLATGTVGTGAQPKSGAETQTTAGAATPATTDADGAPPPVGGKIAGAATGTATGATGAGPNLVLSPDGAPAETASAPLVAAAGSGTSTPGKANSLVTGSSDVVTAKTAIRTGAIDPTTTGTDAKAKAAGGSAPSSTPAQPTLANGGDGTAAGTERVPSPPANDPTGSRTARPDAAPADRGAPTAAAATAGDAGALPSSTGAATAPGAVAGSEATTATQHAPHAGAARAVPGPMPVFDQIALNVHRAAADGMDRITIQLKPESLGRVDVHLQLGHDGRMTATFVADRQDTLDMLQRDARGLERALNDAGLRTDTGGLSFNLRGDGRDFGASAQNGGQTAHDDAGGSAADANTVDAAARPARAANGLLDISV